MEVLVVYESMYGNTRAIADAIAEGARERGASVTVQPVSAEPSASELDLLVVGGPTHMHGLSSDLSRRLAADAAKEDEHPLDPAATSGPGLRAWLRGLGDISGAAAAAFDTRADSAAALTGSAARHRAAAAPPRLRDRGPRELPRRRRRGPARRWRA